MRIIFRIILVICLLYPTGQVFSQFLSDLAATRNDALYTTYAAPMSRSQYKTDQGYRLLWNDDESGVQMISSDGGNLGLAIRKGGETRFMLGELYREPVVTASYSDLVKYYYYPYKDIRVEVFFDVYSSTLAISEVSIRNEGDFPAEISALPYYYCPSTDSVNDIRPSSPLGIYRFGLKKKRDSWMKEHDIPFTEDLVGVLSSDLRFDSIHTFILTQAGSKEFGRYMELKSSIALQRKDLKFIKGIIMDRKFRLQPGDQVRFRIITGIRDTGSGMQDIYREMIALFKTDLRDILLDDEKAYSRIPDPGTADRDLKFLYWSCFSLLRQCMMPPEGECHYNYYVFSREPKWGWGYGGQVFHESLSMMAYALMDPEGAMNSQRVYFERQHTDGYINYRTGPYLDENIEYNGELTSSAPWFNYENLEIYKITKDKKFLEEAYSSGKKFYRYYVARRDSNNNGLCEWGGHAELESVRDARVAVWDQVGWPSNFEGPDLNSMLVKEASSLSEMAKILDLADEEKAWKQDVEKRSLLVNKYLWDDGSGFYYNVNRNDQSFTYHVPNDLKRKEIIGFLPLWAHIADSARAGRLIIHMKDPAEFWREYGVPVLSASDPYYAPMGYWNGPVWVQWDYLLFRGLLDYGYRSDAEQLSRRVMNNMIWNLKNDHVFWEFYSPDDRQAGWNRTYIWAGIAARFILDLK